MNVVERLREYQFENRTALRAFVVEVNDRMAHRERYFSAKCEDHTGLTASVKLEATGATIGSIRIEQSAVTVTDSAGKVVEYPGMKAARTAIVDLMGRAFFKQECAEQSVAA